MKKILLLIMALLVSGCAVKELSKEEQLNYIDRKQNYSKKIYEGYTKSQLVCAGEKVLKNIDDDTKIYYTEDGFDAVRKFQVIMIFMNGYGYDLWKFRVKNIDNGKKLAWVKATTEANHGMFANPPDVDRAKRITMSNSKIIPAEAWGFFNRMDYFLNKSKDWTTCEQIKQFSKENLKYKYKSRSTYPGVSLLCGFNYFGLNPDGKPKKHAVCE